MKKLLVSLVVFASLAITVNCSIASAAPLKVFILVGQSNMEGHAAVTTFPHIGMDQKTAPMLKDMLDNDGNPVVLNDVYISYSTGTGKFGQPLKPVEKQGKLTAGFGSLGKQTKIGPEFTFGIYMYKHLNEPFLIIKTAWGGKSLNTDFRPPSAGPHNWEGTKVPADKKAAREEGAGVYYKAMINHVKKVLDDLGTYHPAYNENDGYKLEGLVWFQGFNDAVDSKFYPNRNKPDGYKRYTKLLRTFINDVRNDLEAPKLPFVIGVMGIGGPVTEESEAAKAPRYRGITGAFRSAMAAPASMPEFKDTVVAVHTDQYWDEELDELVDRKFKKLNPMIKEASKGKKLNYREKKDLADKLMDEVYTPEEIKKLETGVSNQGFHYHGSAKIIGQIGKAFADAAFELISSEKEEGSEDELE